MRIPVCGEPGIPDQQALHHLESKIFCLLSPVPFCFKNLGDLLAIFHQRIEGIGGILRDECDLFPPEPLHLLFACIQQISSLEDGASLNQRIPGQEPEQGHAYYRLARAALPNKSKDLTLIDME